MQDLCASLAHRHETSPHDAECVLLYNPGSKFVMEGAKMFKIWQDFE